MTTPNEAVLQHNIGDLTEQLYACYARIKVLADEVAALKYDNQNLSAEFSAALLKINDLQIVIDGLANEIAYYANRD